ncbi:MAG: rRNA maturation RNase YbeY [Candidatus Delongbacteria bacterium]|nr:rRNA maturation RNase YbeY [Candidatus Delongbacteria bacterium]MBN2836255.1 rRNA maturation RNase YbeY [Candidatus Delongbacteria bacterium]
MEIFLTNDTKTKITKTKIKSQILIFEEKFNIKCGTLSVSFISDEDMERLNTTYLGHEGSTDIITFDYKEENSDLIDGELIICVDQAKRQSRQYKVILDNELSRLVFHGLLHLKGFNDHTDQEREIMHEMENELLDMMSVKSKND